MSEAVGAVEAEASTAEPSDEQLMTAYAQGDARAFEHLYARHKGPLYRYCLRSLNNRALADDLFQEIWEKIINARSRYQPTARFTTWLYRVAHNALVDQIRKSASDRSVPSEAEQADSITTESVVERAEKASNLMNKIFSLPFEQREALLLKEERGLSLEQIATVCGVGRETIKSRLRYALARLRTEAEDD